jgi:hypothetical protein
MLQRILTRLVLEQRLGHTGAVILSDADEQDEEYFLRFDREAFVLFNKEKLTKQSIKKSMEAESLNPNAIHRLILDFLLKTGMHEEAMTFAGEVGINFSSSRLYLIFKAAEELEGLIEQRCIDEVVSRLNQLDPRILAFNRMLNVQLLLLKLDATDKESMAQLISQAIVPLIERCPDAEERERLTNYIEKCIGGLFFRGKLPLIPSDVMEAIRKGLYKNSNLGVSSKLEELVEVLATMQEVLGESCEFKHIDECELFRINDELSQI